MTSIPILKPISQALLVCSAFGACSAVAAAPQSVEDSVRSGLNVYDQMRNEQPIVEDPVSSAFNFYDQVRNEQPFIEDAIASGLNIYHLMRSEQLIDAGQRSMNSGEFAAAEQLFLDAVQVAKVNHGLNSPKQRIPLEYAIAAQIAQGKWEAVDDHVDYFEWLNWEVYQQDFYGYLRGTEQLHQLLLKASADGDNPQGFRYLLAARNLNWRAVAGIEATLGEYHPELAPWLYSIVLTHYYQSTLSKRLGMQEPVFLGREDGGNGENGKQSGWLLNKNESLRISYRVGEELLARIAELYAGKGRNEGREGTAAATNSESAAIATIYQADWEMLFGFEEEALRLYRMAYNRLLAADVSAEKVDRLFARPVPLPMQEFHTSIDAMLAGQSENPARFEAWSDSYPATAMPSAEVATSRDMGSRDRAVLRFDYDPRLPAEVRRNSRAIPLGFHLHNLEVLDASPDSEDNKARASHELSLIQFRPPLRNGLPARSEDIELLYLFPPEETFSLEYASPENLPSEQLPAARNRLSSGDDNTLMRGIP